MRSVSGVKNRIVLGIAALVLALAAAWLAGSFADLASRWPELDPLLAEPDTRVGTLVAQYQHWLLPATLAVAILIVLVGISVLIAQIPRKARTSALRLTSEDGALLATLSPEVLGRALGERAEEIPGVGSCSVSVAGATRSLWLQAVAKISEDAEMPWVVSELRQRLYDDATVATGYAPNQVDLVIRPVRARQEAVA